MKTLFIDLETTGLSSHRNSIIELAAILEEGNEVKEVYHKYCKPETRPADFDKITGITGITWDFLEKHGIPEKILYNSFLSFLDKYIDKFDKKDKLVFCAYNARFDESFLRELFKRHDNSYYGAYFYPGTLDIMTTLNFCIRHKMIDTPLGFKNADTAAHLGIKFDKKLLHSAIEDIRLSKKIQETLEILIFERGLHGTP